MSKQSRIRTQELRKAQQEAAQKAAKRRRLLTALGGVVIVGLIAAIIVVVVRATGGDDSTSSASGSGDVVEPANVTDWSIPVGDDAAPVTVAIYYDYMCPACGAFEQANGDELDRLVEEGTAKVELRPISFLDPQSAGTEYSTRTANAIATVADGAPEAAWEFHRALYEAQPQEGGEGLTDEEIARIATDAGVPSEVADRFAEGTYEGWVVAATTASREAGVEGTPTVLVDGEAFQGDLYTPGALTEAIESAAGQ